MTRIAIVGGGAAGVLAGLALAKALRDSSLRITIFEPRASLGRGVAYSTTEPSHLLNVPAGRMSALYDEPGHFLEWCRRTDPSAGADRFVARRDYGRYLDDSLHESTDIGRVELDWIRQPVTAIQRTHQGFSLATEGHSYEANAVILAVGIPEPVIPARFDTRAADNGRKVVRDPWDPGEQLIPSEDGSLLLIGSGLTAVDVVLTAKERRFRGRIVMFSRHGLVPTVHQNYDSAVVPRIDPSDLLPHEILRAIRMASKTVPWRAVVDSLRSSTVSIWRGWNGARKAAFMRHLRSYWEVHRHRMAPPVAEALEEMRRSGVLEVKAGSIVRIEPCSNGFEVIFRERGKSTETRETFSRVVNCTGFGSLGPTSFNGLLGEILNAGLVRLLPNGLGVQTIDGGVQTATPGLFVIGALLRGERWESTAVPELRQQAAEIARRLSLLYD